MKNMSQPQTSSFGPLVSLLLQRIPDNKCCGAIYQEMRRQRMLKGEYM